jgi:hypothetical protein
MPDADAQRPVRGSGTHSLYFRQTSRERFPALDLQTDRRPLPAVPTHLLVTIQGGSHRLGQALNDLRLKPRPTVSSVIVLTVYDAMS